MRNKNKKNCRYKMVDRLMNKRWPDWTFTWNSGVRSVCKDTVKEIVLQAWDAGYDSGHRAGKKKDEC